MRSYKPEDLFDENGALIAELKEMAPEGDRRITANPHANGGKLRKPLDLPNFADYAVKVEQPGHALLVIDGYPGPFPARRHAQEHDKLSSVRPG